MAANPTLRSIGQVLASLKGDFPDISISKIRFLESVGLLSPERAPSGYRRYSESDVERLRYILRVQKSHYLPLKVIREHLEMMDRGLEPPRLDPIRPQQPAEDDPDLTLGVAKDPAATAPDRTTTGSAAGPTDAAGPGAGQPGGQQTAGAGRQPSKPIRLSRADLLQASGLTDSALTELESIQVVVPRRGTQYYGREALAIAVAARRLAVYGIDSRHLRAFKLAADREIGLVEQAIAPHVRRGARDGRGDVAAEVTQLVIGVHAALIRTGMDH
ncbi:transcriptional regulator FtsR [Microlunatus soli]|uniref:MerR family regulatory protein n=1 Tax=Microlunatus soli TaxID=630515 RepID=A0A1H2AMQ5_9ACTN|nr:MerR family transcriptional regulator [Microlunatus soli]SDT47159.1 MerR family regulatory protein [Microlunatus soli]